MADKLQKGMYDSADNGDINGINNIRVAVDKDRQSLTEDKADPPIEQALWDDFEDYEIDIFWENQKRCYSDILEINSILAYFEDLLINKKTDISQVQDLHILEVMQEHYRLFAAGKFTYEKEFPKANEIYLKLKNSITKFCHPFDTQMVQTNLIQLMFPLDLIDDYLSLVNRTYGQPVYDQTLRMQTSMMETFLWHHFKSDTRFNLALSTANLNLIDPFLRIKIRDSNRNDPKIKQKYFNGKFDLKKFAVKLLDLYFPNVTWRYIGGNQHMHRWSLQLILIMFEQGLWEYEELADLISILFQKLENLLILEDRSYRDFETALSKYPDFIEKLKKYFYECKEMTTGICLHIILLINDHSLQKSHNYFNPSHKVDAVIKNKVWEDAYFSNTDISNILHRILTKYILRASKDKSTSFSHKTIQYASDFLMMVTDKDSDMFYVSSKTINNSMLKFYLSPVDSKTKDAAISHRLKFLQHLDSLATCFGGRSISKREVPLLRDLKALIGDISALTDIEQRKAFQYSLALESVPNIILATLGMLIQLHPSKECKAEAVSAFIEATRGSVISQVLFLDNAGIEHIRSLFDEEPLFAMMIIEEVFKEDFHIFYVHRTIFNNFIDYFHLNSSNFLSNLKDFDNSIGGGERVYLNHEQWLREFIEEITGERSTQLEELLTYCLYVRWLTNLLLNQDTDFEEKFEEFILQRSLVKPFFDFFLQILTDKDFLAKKEDGSYDFTPHLRSINSTGIRDLMDKKEEGSLSVGIVRGIVFEAAILSLELLNRCCERFYTNEMYSNKVLPVIDSLLDKTEYLVDIEGGFEYRSLVLQLYSLMKVFPNNHLLANREIVFKGPKLKCENWIPDNHLNQQTADSIAKQIRFVAIMAQKKDVQQDLHFQTRKFFFEGLFPMVMKYTKGMLYLYSNDANLDKVVTSFNIIDEALKDVCNYITIDFNIDLPNFVVNETKVDASSPFTHISKLVEENDALLTPKSNKDTTAVAKVAKRVPDAEERFYPNLYKLRESMFSIIARISAAYNKENSPMVTEAFKKIELAYTRSNPLTSQSNFDQDDQRLESIGSARSRDNAVVMSLATMLVKKTGLDDRNMRYFKDLMAAYIDKKKQRLSADKQSHIFIKFLESGSGNADNIVAFFVHMINRVYEKLLQKPEEGENQEASNATPSKITYSADLPLMNFLETDLLFSFMSFLDTVSNECTLVKEALLSQISSTDEGKNFLSIIYRITLDLGLICQYKTFMDYDWKLMMRRFQVMTSFLKNLCENNFVGFKKLFGEFKPKIPQLATFNSEDKDLFYHLYMWIEANSIQYKLTNTHHQLLMNDRAEVYSVLTCYFRVIAECVGGPYKPSQNRIYNFRTDSWMAVVNRTTDNMTSNSYDMKDTMLDYIICLTEENAEATLYMSNNATFTRLFDLICLLLKRLYIITTVSQNKKKHARLVATALEAYKKKRELKKLEQDKYEEYLQSQFGFYSQKAITKDADNFSEGLNIAEMLGNQREEEDDTVYFEPSNPFYVNSEMTDCVKITDYESIIETYLKSEEFSSSKLLGIAMKLNDLLLKFAKAAPSYSISMDNVYCALIDRYGEDVPLFIRRKYIGYERKKNYEFNEKLVFYMFLTKITAEIEIRDAETGKDISLLYPLMPCTFFMTDQTKSGFMMSVDHSQIVTCLVDKFEVFQVEMTENLAFYRRWPIFYYLSSDDSFTKIKSILWFLGFVLNILLIIFYSRDAEKTTIEPQGFKAIIVLGVIIAFLSCAFLFIWMMARYGQKVHNAKIEHELPKDVHPQGYTMLVYRMKIYLYYSFLCESYPVFFVIHLLSSILGLTVSPFFLTLQLLTIVFISATTLYVVQAITTHFDQLILTFILSVFVMYCYAVLTSEAFFDTLSNNKDNLTDCTKLWDCFLFHVNFGIRSGGGIADVTERVSPIDQPGYYIGKFFFDLMFFILINIISLNIIFGIIIDTFADMRDESSARSKID